MAQRISVARLRRAERPRLHLLQRSGRAHHMAVRRLPPRAVRRRMACGAMVQQQVQIPVQDTGESTAHPRVTRHPLQPDGSKETEHGN